MIKYQRAIDQLNSIALLEVYCIRQCNDCLPAITHGDADVIRIDRISHIASVIARHATRRVWLIGAMWADDFPGDCSSNDAARDCIQVIPLPNFINEINNAAIDAPR